MMWMPEKARGSGEWRVASGEWEEEDSEGEVRFLASFDMTVLPFVSRGGETGPGSLTSFGMTKEGISAGSEAVGDGLGAAEVAGAQAGVPVPLARPTSWSWSLNRSRREEARDWTARVARASRSLWNWSMR